MKKLLIFLLLLTSVSAGFVACSDDDEYDSIVAWREANIKWLAETQGKKNADGTPYYQVVVPKWNNSSFVLVHYFNERKNDPTLLKPLYTSTVDVRYRLQLYNGIVCDSSSTLTENGPGIYRAKLNDLIDGWAAAVCDMNVGDTAEIVVPYDMGYGESSQGSIPAYSNLVFNIRLADIVLYEKSPEEEPETDE